MTTEYLVLDGFTGRSTWVVAATPSEAVIRHENARRAAPDRHPLRPAALLPLTARVTHARTDRADLIDVSIGDSSCVGRAENVWRAH